jgi:hypothetical protein
MDLARTSVDELYALARSSQDEEAYWAVVTELHTRVNDHTFRIADVLCDSLAVGERCLGADVLGQLGAVDGVDETERQTKDVEGEVTQRPLALGRHVIHLLRVEARDERLREFEHTIQP